MYTFNVNISINRYDVIITSWPSYVPPDIRHYMEYGLIPTNCTNQKNIKCILKANNIYYKLDVIDIM